MPTYTLQAVTFNDVPAVARMSADAFKTDRQTQMKALGKEQPFNMEQYTLQALPGMLVSPRCVVLKVVDATSGDIMGYCNWGFHGFAPKEMPVVEGRTQRLPMNTTTPQEDNFKAHEGETPTDPVKRLEALTSADMKAWMDEVMPASTPMRCLFVIGLIVAPQYQGRGVGSSLLKWGTDLCDKHGAFAWVHSSEPAWKMYEKSGFEVIRSLDVNLDEYAPVPPPNEGARVVWGHYVFRYMKYFPGNRERKGQHTKQAR